MKTITLKELGNKLPVPHEDGRRPSFAFRNWKMQEEKQMGAIKQKHQHLGRFVREVFDYMLVEYAGKEWKSIEENQRKLILSGQPWANIFYMYVCLRIDALGEQMKMAEFRCPSCAFPIKNFTADLTTMEVRAHGYKENEEDEDDKREAVYVLKRPFEMGDLTITGLRYGFTPWRAMENVKQHERNEGSVKESMMKASLLSAVSEENPNVTLDKSKILEQLSKIDIEGYYDVLDEFNGGPRLAMDVNCLNCGHEFRTPLNWTYDYFFGNSSL